MLGGLEYMKRIKCIRYSKFMWIKITISPQKYYKLQYSWWHIKYIKHRQIWTGTGHVIVNSHLPGANALPSARCIPKNIRSSSSCLTYWRLGERSVVWHQRFKIVRYHCWRTAGTTVVIRIHKRRKRHFWILGRI